MEQEGLRDVRAGILFLMVSALMAFAAPLLGMGTMMAMGFMAPPMMAAFAPGILMGMAVLFLASAIVALLGLFVKMRRGLHVLSQVDGRFGAPYTGTTLMGVGIVLIIIGLVFLATAMMAWMGGLPSPGMMSPFMGVMALFFIGGILAFIGYILAFVVLAFRLHDKYRDGTFLAAAILYIVDLVLWLFGIGGLLSFVGHLLMYMALGRASAAAPTS